MLEAGKEDYLDEYGIYRDDLSSDEEESTSAEKIGNEAKRLEYSCEQERVGEGCEVRREEEQGQDAELGDYCRGISRSRIRSRGRRKEQEQVQEAEGGSGAWAGGQNRSRSRGRMLV